mmetsp:Transcript_18474/g.50867  ORF Transcript_18474/g.50867 Transcript_18474/m.50867 type:complete len:225 (+) Transcript_18474:480-1154(+)
MPNLAEAHPVLPPALSLLPVRWKKLTMESHTPGSSSSLAPPEERQLPASSSSTKVPVSPPASTAQPQRPVPCEELVGLQSPFDCGSGEAGNDACWPRVRRSSSASTSLCCLMRSLALSTISACKDSTASASCQSMRCKPSLRSSAKRAKSLCKSSSSSLFLASSRLGETGSDDPRPASSPERPAGGEDGEDCTQLLLRRSARSLDLAHGMTSQTWSPLFNQDCM